VKIRGYDKNDERQGSGEEPEATPVPRPRPTMQFRGDGFDRSDEDTPVSPPKDPLWEMLSGILGAFKAGLRTVLGKRAA
jgi:hypothetical protein